VTGEIIYVDGGYNIINMPRVGDLSGEASGGD
jgi:enoyl-[acyl-carrier-protein] reductase (NADH)